MKLCAMTMVYRDYWALTQWYRHYSAELGAEHLQIVVHGTDRSIAQLCPGAQITHIPRDDLSHFDRKRAILLNAMAEDLRARYDRVIRTDADELICYDPERYSSLADVFRAHQNAPALFALGLELVESSEDAEYDEAQKLSEQRQNVMFSGHYSKAFSAIEGCGLFLHGVKMAGRALRPFPLVMPRGVYLLHLKYANLSAADEANHVRRTVATPRSEEEKGLPGDGWLHAEKDTEAFLHRFERAQWKPWQEAEHEAYELLSNAPRRIARRDVLKVQSLKLQTRTELPDRLRERLP